MMYIIYNSTPLWDYLIKNSNSNHSLSFIKLERKKSFLSSHHIIMKIINKFIGKYIALKVKYYIHDDMRTIKQSDDILLLGIYNYSELQRIRQVYRNNKLILWLWNPVENTYKHKSPKVINNLKKMNYNIYTFDSHDATKFQIGLKPQFTIIPKTLINKNTTIHHDVYFLGQPKGRLQTLNEVKSNLESFGIKCFFIIVNKFTDYISYEDNIKYVCNSRAVLEICQPGQEGITLRTLEAMFCKKKLITNNAAIKHIDFYNKKNIFILGEDRIDGINKFLQETFSPIPDNIMEKYDFNKWLNSFIKKTN